jgi:hypothetical protein
MSGRLPVLSVQVTFAVVQGAAEQLPRKTWPGVAGVFVLKPETAA